VFITSPKNNSKSNQALEMYARGHSIVNSQTPPGRPNTQPPPAPCSGATSSPQLTASAYSLVRVTCQKLELHRWPDSRTDSQLSRLLQEANHNPPPFTTADSAHSYTVPGPQRSRQQQNPPHRCVSSSAPGTISFLYSQAPSTTVTGAPLTLTPGEMRRPFRAQLPLIPPARG
jgi:hypothetical protein